jgi:hypothetical protein
VCIGCRVYFDGVGSWADETGSYDPDNGAPYGGGSGITKYRWNFGDDADDPHWYGDEGDPNHLYEIAGIYTVALNVVDDDNTPSDGNDYCEVWVCEVSEVVERWTADPGPIYVCLNSTVYLEAKPYPSGASFPSGEPHWTIESQPPGGGASLSLSSGSAIVALYGFSKAGNYVVKARCGTLDTGDSITVTAFTIKTETVSPVPANRDRTILGIGEPVRCWSEPPVEVEWSVSPGAGYVDPETGTSTLFTAIKSPSWPTIYATPTTGGCSPILHFTVIAPDGITVSLNTDAPLWTLGDNRIGARSIFNCTVTPGTVSFNWAEFRENIPTDTWIWPDGTEQSNLAHTRPWFVGYDNTTTDILSPHPSWTPQPIGRIYNGSSYVDFNYTTHVPEEYKNEFDRWICWLPAETHPREFRGSDQKARVILNATTSANGGWMGPWQWP